MKTYTLNKEERLKSKKLIDEIFTKGSSVKLGFLRLNFIETSFESEYNSKVAFSVPKRNFKLAVKRNLLKRRMKESFRLNKFELYDFLTANNLKIGILFVYLAKEEKSYQEIDDNILKIFKKLQTHINEKYI